MVAYLPIRHGANSTKLEVTGYGVEENVPLDKKKIDTEDNVAVVCQYMGW
jgi:hypothetical protein